ncbi:Wzz/FepE/Etk N-terminal domain-containing protein, partial [Micromonospora sp. NPDC049089]
MDLLRQLRHVRRHWWVALVTVMVALGVSAFLTVRAQPRYVASVTFFVTTPNTGVTDAYQGGLFLQQRVKSYADLLSSDRLAQSVVAETPVGLTADEVQRRVSTSTETGTVLLRASVTDTDQARALRVTESLANKFVELVQKVETTPEGKAPIKIEIVSGPRVSANPVSPQPVRNLTLGGLVGLLLGIGLAILRGVADVRLRDAAGLQRATGSPLLGEIPFEANARSAPLIVGDAATSARAEAVRKLR